MSWLQEADLNKQAISDHIGHKPDGTINGYRENFKQAVLEQLPIESTVLTEAIRHSNKNYPDCPQLKIVSGTEVFTEATPFLTPSLFKGWDKEFQVKCALWMDQDRVDFGFAFLESNQGKAYILPTSLNAVETVGGLLEDAGLLTNGQTF